jgi:hypothetical protein
LGATPAAPVAAGVAFWWRSQPSRQPRLRKRLEPDALPQSARVLQAKRDGRRSRLQMALRPDRGQLQASLDHDLPHVEPHATAERPPAAVEHPELTCPERISGATFGDADRAGFEPVCVARPGGRGGCSHENSRDDAQPKQGAHPSRSVRACRKHAFLPPRRPGPDATSRASGRGSRKPKRTASGGKCYPPGPGSPAELKNVMLSPTWVAGGPAQLCTSSR